MSFLVAFMGQTLTIILIAGASMVLIGFGIFKLLPKDNPKFEFWKMLFIGLAFLGMIILLAIGLAYGVAAAVWLAMEGVVSSVG